MGDDEAELAELIALGVALPPRITSPLPKSFWNELLPEASVDLVALIREDRDSPVRLLPQTPSLGRVDLI